MLMIQTLPEFRLVAGMASKTPATQAAHYIPATNTQPVQPPDELFGVGLQASLQRLADLHLMSCITWAFWPELRWSPGPRGRFSLD